MFDAGAIVFSIRAAGAQVFRQDLAQADKAVETLGKSSKTAADKTEELGKKQDRTTESTRRQAKAQQDAAAAARELGSAQDEVGKVLVTAGAAIVATTALTVNSAIQWESAWAGVTKTVEGTPEVLAEVEAGLRGLTSVLPASHDEIAAVAEAAGQLGVKTQDVVGFTRTMIDLGETTNLTSDQAATSLAQFMNIMGTAGEDVDRLGSTIVALGNDGASTEADIVSMAQRIAGSGKLVGATEGEVLALSNALASMGVTAELGGGVASRILQDLYSAVQTGGERLDAFAQVAGTSASDFATAFENDPIRAMGAFATGLNGVESSGGNVVQTLSDLGFKSTEEQRVLLQLKSAGDLLTDSLDLQNTAWDENSALTDEAAKRYDTVESKLGIMQNRVNDAAIDLGSVFLPVLADVAEGVGGAADGFASLPAPLQEAIAVGGLLVGTIALIGGTALIAIPKVVQFRASLALLTAQSPALVGGLGKAAAFMTGPWGIAIVAAAAGAMLLEKHIDSLKASSEEYQNVIANAKSADELFAIADQGTIISDLKNSTKSAEDFQDALNTIRTNDFARGLSISISQLKARLEEMGGEFATLSKTDLPAAQNAFRLLADDMELSKDQQIQLLDSMPEYKAALIDLANQQGINVTSTDDAANATKLLELAQGDGADQSKTAARAYIEAADGASQLESDLSELLDLLNEANGVGQDAITANLDYKNALAEVDEQVRNARDGVEGFALGLEDSTQTGRDNMGMLVDLAQKGWDAAESQYALDGNTEAYRQNLENSRQELLTRIEDLGLSGQAAEDLADQIMQIPSETEWKVIAQTQAAQIEIDNFVNRNQGKTINVWMNPKTQAMNDAFATYLNGDPNADGGIYSGGVKYFANGGIENHVAQIARKGGNVRIWAEPETEGETYLPHAMSKRARSEQLLAETAGIFGGTYIPAGARAMADGAVVGAPAAQGPVRVILEAKGDLFDLIDVRIENDNDKRNREQRGW